jgi:hypothetical protein
MWYAYGGGGSQALLPVSVERVAEIIDMNRNGRFPDEIIDLGTLQQAPKLDYTDGVGEESLTRFENKRSKKKKRRNPQHNPKPKS